MSKYITFKINKNKTRINVQPAIDNVSTMQIINCNLTLKGI